MKTPNDKRIWVTWSGGIDSTAVLGKLLKAGYEVFPIAVEFGSKFYSENEKLAREEIAKYFKQSFPAKWNDVVTVSGSFFMPFSSDGKEVMRRNKHIMDYVMMNHVIPDEFYYIGMGSHLGADTPSVDHLKGGNDTDSRHMNAYLLAEYGIGFQLLTLLDFGPSRFKTDRIKMLLEVVPEELAFKTYNCLTALELGAHCGQCYKCVERRAACVMLGQRDFTEYVYNPEAMPFFVTYIERFNGDLTKTLSWEDIRMGEQGSHSS